MRVPGLRALRLFWLAVIGLAAGTFGLLAWLGPPPDLAPRAPVEAAAPPAPSPPPQPAPQAIEPVRLVAIPAGLPAAPDPPPLAEASPRLQAALPAGEAAIAPPDPALLEPSRHGPVPRLGPENRTSIRTYARPFDRADPRPRLGIVVNNIGLSAPFSEEAIRRLPGGVTLAFSPYAIRPEPLLERARARGMEALVALPLEPQGFGQGADPGPQALLTGLGAAVNHDRLLWALSRIQGQVGAIGGLGGLRGERFAANAELLGALQQELTQRGLLYVDPRPGAPTPARAFGRAVDIVVDEPSTTAVEVTRQLMDLEALARQGQTPIGLANNPAPTVVAAIAAWAEAAAGRGVVIAPITALIRRPSEQAAR